MFQLYWTGNGQGTRHPSMDSAQQLYRSKFPEAHFEKEKCGRTRKLVVMCYPSQAHRTMHFGKYNAIISET